jgi:glycosyltransferase involved in cell wall biosynthesis
MRIGTVCYATDQGLGILAKQWFDHRVISDVLVFRHGVRPTHMEWYPPGTRELVDRPFSGPAIDEFLSHVKVMVFFETPFDWDFPDYCRSRGIKTVLVPMYEWHPKYPRHRFDKYICPSLLDQQYFPNSPFIPPPVNPSVWRQRAFATRFLHNAGNIGHRHHKGTAELIQAIPMLSDRVQLTIRAQDERAFLRLVSQYNHVDLSRVTVELGNRPYGSLFDGYDVYVAPEKFNGLSLPLQEAFAHGLAVMASDRFPANTWLPKRALIPVRGYHRAAIGPSYFEFDEAEVSPVDIAKSMNEMAGQDIRDLSVAGLLWAEENSWRLLRLRLLKELTTW